MADTTWRMVVPGLLLAGLGIAADLKFGTKPWLTLVGLTLGLAIGALLVKRQLEHVQ
jgi:F0F1-type ATP synthase assembly protein I